MILSRSLFLVCVTKQHIQSAIMLPNTKHIVSGEHRMKVKNRINDVIAFHNSQKITTGRLGFMPETDKKIGIYVNTENRPETIEQGWYQFQKARKRFNEFDLMNEMGEIPKLHPRQQEYLDSKIITHAWAALHKGHVVGLITYPFIKNTITHDKNFERFKSLARKALQTVGYVVSCDLVLNSNNELQIFNIHEEYEKNCKTIPYFTRLLPTTSHLCFADFPIDFQKAV